MWMNKEGGFADSIHYNKVKDAAMGLSTTQIMSVLKQCEKDKDDVDDATEYICRNLKAFKDWAAGSLSVENPNGPSAEVSASQDWISPQEWMNMMFAEVAQQAQEAKKQEETKAELEKADWKFRVRLMWLNNEGGFANQINYRKVKDAATGLASKIIMQVLKDAQQQRQIIISDPTAFIVEALMSKRIELGTTVGVFDASTLPVAPPAFGDANALLMQMGGMTQPGMAQFPLGMAPPGMPQFPLGMVPPPPPMLQNTPMLPSAIPGQQALNLALADPGFAAFAASYGPTPTVPAGGVPSQPY